jgi:lipoprotein-anchoring transpeptidase ErfK/SrfK
LIYLNKEAEGALTKHEASPVQYAGAVLDFGSFTNMEFDSKTFHMQRTSYYISFLIILPIMAVLLTSCETNDPRFSAQNQYLGGTGTSTGAPGAPIDNVSYWDGDGVSGKPSVKISLGEQRAYFYKSGTLVGISQLSTGREGLNTPHGKFSVIQKDIKHVSSLYGDYVDASDKVVKANVDVTKDPKPPGTHFKGAPMPYFMRVTQGIGLHAGYLPGFPASHGCIRMPEFMAEDFFKSVSVGTPVAIVD